MVISVYLGSSTSVSKEYEAFAYKVGRTIAEAGHVLVYGGANVGTMKCLADGAQDAGGEVIGVFPEGFLGTKEIQEEGIDVMRKGLSRMVLTADFAERKRVMEELGDCAIALPGSYGTLDEIFNYTCDRTIGKHSKNLYLLNYKGFYEPVRKLLNNIDTAGFLKPSARDILIICDSLDDCPPLKPNNNR